MSLALMNLFIGFLFSIMHAKENLFLPLACKINGEIPSIAGSAKNLNPKVLNLAMTAYTCARKKGFEDPRQILTIIDYSLPSTEKRMWVIDLKQRKVLFNTLVAQGKNTEGLFGEHFSNQPESKATSLGLFLTESSYEGHNGYSLRIRGLEPGFNEKAEQRNIVIHGAWYVSESFIRREGRLGTSWGCPAVGKDIVRPLINDVKEGTLLFSYYPDPNWLANSTFLHCSSSFTQQNYDKVSNY
jgi:hypothetical protein